MSTPQPTQPIRIDPNEPLSQEKALAILIQSINLAQSKGVYNFEEAELLAKCVRKFTKPPQPPQSADQPSQPTITDNSVDETVVL